jgi:hypothetical protein
MEEHEQEEEGGRKIPGREGGKVRGKNDIKTKRGRNP